MSIHESTAAYLLNALDEDERARFETHLAGCEECRREVAELRVASDVLPMTVEQIGPPAHLKDRIMATVEAEAELLAAAGAGADRSEPAARDRRRYDRLRSLRIAGAFACGLALAIGVGVLATDGGEARLVAAQTAPAGARVFLEVGEDSSTLLAENLPEPPAGRVYQVWISRGEGSPEPTDALFTPLDGKVTVGVNESMEGVEALLVTDEPRQGSHTPTTRPIIAIRPI